MGCGQGAAAKRLERMVADIQHPELKTDTQHTGKPRWLDDDEVTRPRHYTDSNIEAIDYIKDKLGPAFKYYCIGNVIKYVSRAGKKGPMKVDLQKAKQYIEWAIDSAD